MIGGCDLIKVSSRTFAHNIDLLSIAPSGHDDMPPVALFVPVALAPSTSPTPAATVQRADSLQCAAKLLRHSAARCVYVRRAFQASSLTLPPGYDQRDIRVDGDRWHGDDILSQLAWAHCTVTGATFARARIARVQGTPCPRAHVDKLRLRAMVTLQGPGVVILHDSQPDRVALRAAPGDAVFMKGVGELEEDDDGVWHRSPRRALWMRDRIVVQVDDW